MAKMVLGIFDDRIAAEDAILTLQDNRYDPKDISIVMKDKKGKELAKDNGMDIVGSAVSGAATIGVLGAQGGLLVGVGIVPGIGVLLVGGPLAQALGLSGAAAPTVARVATGALAGGILGALAGLGLSDDETKVYEQSIKDGGVLIAVPARLGEEVEVEAILADFGANQIRTTSTGTNSRVVEEEDYAPAYFSEVDHARARKRRSRK